MLFQQLADNSDIVAQLRALDELAEKPDRETVAKIQSVLQSAEHYGVRIRAAEVLKQARTSDSLEALCVCLTQPDARVRNAVVSALGGFFEPKAQEQLTKVVAFEKNPGVIATALRALGPYQNQGVRQLLTDALSQPSYRDRILEGALAGIRTQDDPRFAQSVTAVVQERIAGLPGPIATAALETLGFLSRHEQNRDNVRETLTRLLTSERETIRLAAISGLGLLEDARASGVLETFSNATQAKPEKAAALKALEKIRAARKGSEELKGLRDEIAELKKTEAELKKDFENFRKKIESK
jgi:HEAT repeat protein